MKTILLGLSILVGVAAVTGYAQDPDASGVIAGSVTVDEGDVRSFRVKARDTARRITGFEASNDRSRKVWFEKLR